MVVDCQISAADERPSRRLASLLGIVTSGLGGAESGPTTITGGRRGCNSQSGGREEGEAEADHWRRRRRRRRKEAPATSAPTRSKSEMILMKAMKIERRSMTKMAISNQTLALGNSHYERGDPSISRQRSPSRRLQSAPARGERSRRPATGRRSGKLDYVIVFTATLMILTTFTLANIFTNSTSATTSAPMLTSCGPASSAMCARTGFAGAEASAGASRTTDDKKTNDDHHHNVQSILQRQQQRQQQQIPFTSPLKQGDPQLGATTMANSSTDRQLAKRAPAHAEGSSNNNRVAHHPVAQQAQNQQQLTFLQQLRISETDLLPFSDFSVQQPAFSDIMKSWPPTTRQKQRQQHNDNDNYLAAGKRRGAHHSRAPRPHQSSEGPLDDPAGQWQIRNHLNEDYDDTIVTADESFEQDQLPEPPTWVNYLGELGDLVYSQLSLLATDSPASAAPPAAATTTTTTTTTASNKPARQQRAEIVEDLLDDFYYDQYENSQVLYYGPQLVRQGDIFEIGCYLPNEQPAEWTKSGRSIVTEAGEAVSSAGINPLRVVKRGDFMGAKQNYSLKVFEAQLGDTGNYRCNRLSRKYHKLIVIPQKVSPNQQYLYQQRLLSVVGREWAEQEKEQQNQHRAALHQHAAALSQQQVQLATLYQTSALLRLVSGQPGQPGQPGRARAGQSGATIQASGGSVSQDELRNFNTARQNGSMARMTPWSGSGVKLAPGGGQYLAPSLLIREHQPLSVQCHISDELILRKLREMPQFQLAWYKNGRLLRGSQQGRANQQQAAAGRQSSLARPPPDALRNEQRAASSQRVQFVGPNGRQMFVHSANYADAGDYLCSWAKLVEMLRQSADESSANGDELQAEPGGAPDYSLSSASSPPAAPSSIAPHPASAASHHQLVAPVKLRPFKSAYHVRAGNQLRLICQVQRGYPSAFISWYVGNQLVDGDFLREHPNEFRVLQLQAQNRSGAGSALATSGQQEGGGGGGDGGNQDEPGARQAADESQAQIVEINPIPAGRQQMQLTANGRGQWIEYRDLTNEKYAIDSQDKQLRYLQMKLAQLTGTGLAQSAGAGAGDSPTGGGLTVGLQQQASLSVLVVNKLQHERHTSRYACRATGRANTDEVTTVIRVKDSATIVIQPNNKAATLIPGQPLHFECAQIGRRNAQFVWLKKSLTGGEESLLEPNVDDTIEIHNERLTLLKPTYQSVGDYICRALDNDKESQTIQVRAAPYVDDFGVETSHTGKSATLDDGDSLELVCKIRDRSVPVNITWLMSQAPDSDYSMVTVPEYESGQLPSLQNQLSPNAVDNSGVSTYTLPSNVMVERMDSFSKRLIVRQLGPEHRGYYTCMVDNGVTERTRKTIYIRVKDKILPLWPFLGILAELFILFTIIYVWETQKAQKSITTNAKADARYRATMPHSAPGSTVKRPASGPSGAFESVPLNG